MSELRRNMEVRIWFIMHSSSLSRYVLDILFTIYSICCGSFIFMNHHCLPLSSEAVRHEREISNAGR
jgi:hypothetical protein